MYLDSIADCVLQELGQSVPDHPIFSIPLEERRKWGKDTLSSDLWDAKCCMTILRAMDYVLIDKLRFHGTKENYHHRENYLIDVVSCIFQLCVVLSCSIILCSGRIVFF